LSPTAALLLYYEVLATHLKCGDLWGDQFSYRQHRVFRARVCLHVENKVTNYIGYDQNLEKKIGKA